MSPRWLPSVLWLAAALFLTPASVRADDFGEIGVSADAMYSGSTYHGYGEIRVTVENHSRAKNHSVTLIAPNQFYGGGNSINRLSRSVELAPGAIKIVSLLQPPLPEIGDGRIRVEVDSGDGGEITAPRNTHCQFNSYDRAIIPNLFVSRSLDFDAVEGIFNRDLKAFTAEMATGMPDAGGTMGRNPNAWMPDTSAPGATNWLELDFNHPATADRLQIFHTLPVLPAGEILLLDDSGAVVDREPLRSKAGGAVRRGADPYMTRLSFRETDKPVKTVRLNFGMADPATISIDAVEISGPLFGRRYATAARASSDDHASTSSPASRLRAARLPNPEAQALRAELAVSDWSDNWLAYTPFDGIALSAADLAALPPPVANALTGYLFAGGNIFIFGEPAANSLPESWRGGQKDFGGGSHPASVGFGRCVILPALVPKKLMDSVAALSLRASLRDTARYWGSLPDSSSAANGRLPVVKSVKIPTRGIVAFMLLFIIIVGPLNIFILKRRKKGAAILWTIPAISAVSTLILFAYSLLREGITPDTRITGLTYLEQASHRATTIGASGFYCPLTPSGGLAFDYGTEVTPLVSFDLNYGTRREVDWTQAQHFRRGWVSARVPAIFHLRKSELRRERLQVQKDNGNLKIVNGLGAPIESLWLAAADGKVYLAKNVAAGQMATLSATTNSVSLEQPDTAALLRDLTFAVRDDSLGASVPLYLSPGSYLARLQGNPFIENALGAASSPLRSKIESVVLGRLEPSETP